MPAGGFVCMGLLLLALLLLAMDCEVVRAVGKGNASAVDIREQVAVVGLVGI